MYVTTIQVPADLTAHDRTFLTNVAYGILSARAKYPGNKHRFHALVGEFGEVLTAVQKIDKHQGDILNLGVELRHTAQMACRLAVEGDPDFPEEYHDQFPTLPSPGNQSSEDIVETIAWKASEYDRAMARLSEMGIPLLGTGMIELSLFGRIKKLDHRFQELEASVRAGIGNLLKVLPAH